MLRILVSGVAGIAVALCIGLVFAGMRGVMYVGGACVSGASAYEVRVDCPDSGQWLLPVGIVGALLFTALFLSVAPEAARPYSVLAWTGLFIAVGYNFLDAGLPWNGQQASVLGILLAAMFFVIGIVPVAVLWKKRGRLTDDDLEFEITRTIDGRLVQGFPMSNQPADDGKPAGRARARSSALSTADALAKLSQMHVAGELSDVEYDRLKAALLGESGIA